MKKILSILLILLISNEAILANSGSLKIDTEITQEKKQGNISFIEEGSELSKLFLAEWNMIITKLVNEEALSLKKDKAYFFISKLEKDDKNYTSELFKSDKNNKNSNEFKIKQIEKGVDFKVFMIIIGALLVMLYSIYYSQYKRRIKNGKIH